MTTTFPTYSDKPLQWHADDPDFLFTGEGFWFLSRNNLRCFDNDEWVDSEWTLDEVESEIVDGSNEDAEFYWIVLQDAERRWVAAGNSPHAWNPSLMDRRLTRLLSGPYPFPQYPLPPVLDEINDPDGRYTGPGWYYTDPFNVREFDGKFWEREAQIDQRMHSLVALQSGVNADYVAKQLDLVERAERIWVASGHVEPHRPIAQLRRWMTAEGQRIERAKAAGRYNEYDDNQIPLPESETVLEPAAFAASPVTTSSSREPQVAHAPLPAPRANIHKPSDTRRRGMIIAVVIAAVIISLIVFRLVSTSSIGATAQCADGTYSHSHNHSGTCSSHGGVAQWLNGSSDDGSSEQEFLNDQNQDGPAVGEP